MKLSDLFGFTANMDPAFNEAIVRNLRVPSRLASIYGFHICLAPLALGGCPAQAVVGKDAHSDKEASTFLSPKHLLKPVWDDRGLVLLQLL